MGNYTVDATKAVVHVRMALKRGVESGIIKLAKESGKGAGSYKLGEKAVKPKKPVIKKTIAKKPTPKKAKKPLADAKKTPVKKDAKKVTAKKDTKKAPAKESGKVEKKQPKKTLTKDVKKSKKDPKSAKKPATKTATDKKATKKPATKKTTAKKP